MEEQDVIPSADTKKPAERYETANQDESRNRAGEKHADRDLKEGQMVKMIAQIGCSLGWFNH